MFARDLYHGQIEYLCPVYPDSVFLIIDRIDKIASLRQNGDRSIVAKWQIGAPPIWILLKYVARHLLTDGTTTNKKGKCKRPSSRREDR